jgi:hypothetical protein
LQKYFGFLVKYVNDNTIIELYHIVMPNSFIKYLNNLLSQAKSGHQTDMLRKFKRYYDGTFEPRTGSNNSGNDTYGNIAAGNAYYNVIKPIVETKATTALDAMITTNVKPANLSHQTFDDLKQLESIADILNDCWENIKRSSELPNISQKVVRDGSIYGVGIAKVIWNQSINNGLGDIRVERVSPLDFYPEPTATTIENCNYIFVKRVISRFDLINQYKNNPEILKKIDKLSSPSATINMGEPTNIVVAGKVTADGVTTGSEMYLNEGGLTPSGTEHNIELYECYLKDDTVLVPLDDDSEQDKEMKTEERFKYPNGRLIIFSGEEILEDRAIDYPFGFPFAVYQPTQSDKLIGQGDVEDLMKIQARLTNAYEKLIELLDKYKSQLAVPKKYANAISSNFDIIEMVPGDPMTQPILFTNKLTQDIQIVRQHIEDLKKDAYKIARINEIMLSGERPTGVNSGQMVRDLVESPMSSIREMQRNFKNFLTDISNKAVVLVQLYYNQPRIIRMASGTRFASMEPNEMGEMEINIYDRDMQTKELEAIDTIKSDLTLGEYEVEITAGSSLPQSQSAIAATTLQLAQQGIFGDINNPDVKELILKTLDYPNYRAIINKIKEEQDEQAQVPLPEPDFNAYIKNVNMSLKDIIELIAVLPIEQQVSAISTITDSLGLTMPQPVAPEQPVQPSFITGIG